MKLIVKHKTEKGRIRKFYLILPTFLIKSKLLIKSIVSNSNSNSNNDDYEDALEDIEEAKELITKKHIDFIKTIYKEIKRYTKKNGHFTLFEVSTDDTFVKIII